MDGDQVDAIEQVFAKLVARDHLVQRPVRRGDHADIDVAADARSQHFEGAVLQDAQHLDLRGWIEVADLVEKDRPAGCRLEAALSIRARVGKGAAHVAEHLALEQRRGNAAQIDLHEWFRRATAVLMNGVGDQFLAGAALAGDEDRRIGWRHPANEGEDSQEPGIAADKIPEVELGVEGLPRRRLVSGLSRCGQAQRGSDRLQHLLIGPGLRDEVRRPRLHAFDREPDRAPRGDEHHWSHRRRGLDLPQELDTLFP